MASALMHIQTGSVLNVAGFLRMSAEPNYRWKRAGIIQTGGL